MSQNWTKHWMVTTVSSWLLPKTHKPSKNQSGKFTSSKTSPKPRRMKFKHCPRVVQHCNTLHSTSTRNSAIDTCPEDLPIEGEVKWKARLYSGQNTSVLEERNKVKCLRWLCWLHCYCCYLFILVCQDLWLFRTKQALVLKGCLTKGTSFNFIPPFHAIRGYVYLES